MRAIDVTCNCPLCKGTMIATTLTEEHGKPVMFFLTEDEHLYFRGICSICQKEFSCRFPIMDLLFKCPKKREVQ